MGFRETFSERIDSKSILLGGAAAFILFLAFSLSVGLRKNQADPPPGRFQGEADIQVKTLSFVQTEKGQPAWALRALQADLAEEGQKARLRNVRVTVPYGAGYQLTLAGDEGEIDRERSGFSLWKNGGFMTVDLDHGYTLRTSGLRWDARRGVLVSQGPAHIAGSRLTMDGNRIVISLDRQEVTLAGDVKALVR